jgi:hypothetical protein
MVYDSLTMTNSNKKRKLLDGSEVDDYDYPIDLILHTRAPAKWKLIDLETGQEYLGSEISHETFGELLRSKVAKAKIGSWFKTKGRVIKNG